jgi:DNA-binding beta-propeller fold protein YncE
MDLNNKRLRAVDMVSGNISTFAFDGNNGETNDPTPRLTAKIQNGRDVVVDSDGNVYVATSQHKKIYKIDADNVTILTPKVFRQTFWHVPG